MVRAGREGIYADDFLLLKIVAIGWREVGEIVKGASKSEIMARCRAAYPAQTDAQLRTAQSPIHRFLNEIEIGATVITYNPPLRRYYIGTVDSEPVWAVDQIEPLPRFRKVKWHSQVQRDVLPEAALNTLGAIQTLFEVNTSAYSELLAKASAMETVLSALPAEVLRDEQKLQSAELKRASLIEEAENSIEQKILALDWEQLQELVAGVLRGMGYKTQVSPRGADRGVDIFASPDGLGLGNPRIFVEVKHRPGQTMGSADVRAFLGGRNADNDRCLYVSTGGFTREAKYEADRAAIPLRLIDLVTLRKLLLEHYPALDEATRRLVPLRSIYVLADG